MGSVVSLVAAHVCSMLGFSTFAALLPQLRDAWSLSNSQAGVVGSMFFAGYIASVSHWTAFTDRADARKVYAVASLVAAAASAAFGWLGNGFASALVFQALLGAGIAGTYMPGLRLLSDRVSGPRQSRAIAFYTASFGIGTALSFALAGAVSSRAGWHMAFRAASAGPLVSAALVLSLRPVPRADPPPRIAPLLPFAAWRSILRRRDVVGYVVGYAVHCLELFGSRGWVVAFLAFADTLRPAAARLAWSPQSIAAAVNLLSVPSSILGNEVAIHVGRRRWILLAMGASGATGVVLGMSAPGAWPLVLALLAVYSMLVMAESATLTAGVVAAAPADLRGAALGLYSLAGFGGGLLGPVLFGAALDLAGGAGNRIAWVAGYAAIGSGCLAAPVVARWFARSRSAP